MTREERLRIINQIEELRGSKVIVYFCGDRPLANSSISSDAVRPLYDHLLGLVGGLEKLEKIDLYLYSRGGALEAPWTIVSMIREYSKKFDVLIPYKCHSASTMVAMGADNIVMGRKGELGPIDPSLHMISPDQKEHPGLPPTIGTEDVSQYVTFIKERVGLTDQQAIYPLINCLADKVNPVVLGQVQRAYSHIRLVGGKLLALKKPPLEEKRIKSIIEALTEKIFLHGHTIGSTEAIDIGLQVQQAKAPLEELLWRLYLQYEELLNLDDTADPSRYLPDENIDEYERNDTDIAVIESSVKYHTFRGKLVIKKVRKIPPNPQLNINVNMQFPPGIDPQQLPQNLQQLLQGMMQQAANTIRQQVIDEIKRQSPIQGMNVAIIGGKWIEPQ